MTDSTALLLVLVEPPTEKVVSFKNQKNPITRIKEQNYLVLLLQVEIDNPDKHTF